jgi:hypothetical protein
VSPAAASPTPPTATPAHGGKPQIEYPTPLEDARIV